jgi:hypothetical protein
LKEKLKTKYNALATRHFQGMPGFIPQRFIAGPLPAIEKVQTVNNSLK